MAEAKEYQGEERELTFVKRFERNPKFGSEDNRVFVQTAEWGFCCSRFRDYWRIHSPKRLRSIPDYRDKDHDGEEGWFFPAIWIVEFEQAKLSVETRPSRFLGRNQGEAA